MPDPNQSSANSKAEEKQDANTTSPDEGKESEGAGSSTEKDESKKGDGEEMVEVSKKRLDHLETVAKRKSEKKSKNSRSTSSSDSGAKFSFEKPDEPDADEVALAQERETNKFKQGVLRTVLKNKDYQKVLDKDKTLAKVLENNPLSLVEEDPVDADDAIGQVVDYLDECVDNLLSDTPKKKKEKDKENESDQPDPTPPKKVEVKKDGQPEERKTLDDVSKGIMGKVKVGGK